MDVFKVGGKVTLGENETYIIVDIIDYNGKKYYFACSDKKPIIPKVFERIDKGEKTYINFVEDIKIIKYITDKVVNK